MLNFVDDFLSIDDLNKCIEYVKNNTNNSKILKDQELTDYIWDKYKDKFLQINSKWNSLSKLVTISNSNVPIGKHKDVRSNSKATEKILIYLNQVENGGTVFYIGDETILIENKPNRLVWFDINLLHSSQDFTSSTNTNKLSIGFRPL